MSALTLVVCLALALFAVAALKFNAGSPGRSSSPIMSVVNESTEDEHDPRGVSHG